MTYKSVLRSMNSAANKSIRDAEREAKKTQREKERIAKKIAAIEAKMEKIIESLSDQLAKGKINSEEYSKLLQRKGDIGLDLIVFGKIPAVSAAKRYICGKIEKSEFKEICSNIISPEIEMEQAEIKDKYDDLLNEIKNFKKSCISEDKDSCQKCGKKKSFLGPIKEFENFMLCGKCKKELSYLINFEGLTGTYFSVSPQRISIDEIDKPNLVVNINSEHF